MNKKEKQQKETSNIKTKETENIKANEIKKVSNIKKKIVKATKWKKNLPHTAWVTGITVPKNLAKESMHTNMKKPVADNKTILNNGGLLASIMVIYL